MILRGFFFFYRGKGKSVAFADVKFLRSYRKLQIPRFCYSFETILFFWEMV